MQKQYFQNETTTIKGHLTLNGYFKTILLCSF